MRSTTGLFCGVAAIALFGAGSALAQAASPDAAAKAKSNAPASAPADAGAQSGSAQGADAGVPTVAEVVVTGFRASLQSAQVIKENASQVVDSIVAADIGKLPDINTAEALSRVTGVQINTDLGEGSTVVIRGLSQVETLMNGRETFTAAGTRTLNFEFIPSEVLAGVDVYKSQSADLVEGGLGGTIDVRTHRPFDFKGLTVSGAALANYGDLKQQAKPLVSALISDRWDTSIGEVGALFDASYEERALREDYISAGAPTCYTKTNGVCTTVGPNGFYNPQYTAQRKRTGFNGSLQWSPTKDLQFYLDANYEKFETDQLDYGTYPTPDGGLTRSSTTYYPGTDIIKSATYLNQPLKTLSISRDTIDTNQQIAIGGKWQTGRLTLKGDISYLKTTEDLYYHELDMQTTLPTFTIDTSSSPPKESYSGVDLMNIANYNFAGLTDSVNHWSGDEFAVKFDGDYDLELGPITDVAFGVRYSDISDKLVPIRYYEATGAAVGPASAYSQLVQAYPYGDAFAGYSGSTINHYLVVNPSLLTNLNKIISLFGLPQPTVQSQGIYTIDEKDLAGYLKVNFAFDLGVRIDGNVGVRIVNTADDVAGTETISATQSTPVTYLPIADKNNYTDALPSINLRAHLRDDLFLRLAAYKSVTRPEFSQLNPGLTLVPANLTGNQGNPNLAPYRADNYDASLEWYFSRSGSLYAAAFYKSVKGFIFTEGVEQTIDGQLYTLSQPINSGAGRVEGAEVGYQQFFSFLPGWLSGFGVQANVTYVDSEAPTSIANFNAPLPNLSKWSYNVVGMYEKGPWSVRLAYDWRSKFLQSITNASGVGIVPTMSKGFGQLAAAVNYDITPHLTLTVEGTNLTRAIHQTYVGSLMSPAATYQDDRQLLAGIRFKW